MITTEVNFFSNALGMRACLNVILPQRTPEEIKKTPQAKFRVLYLLHGHSDDHTAWQRWTSIERYVEGLNMAVIMPAVGVSWYTDMVHGGKYFSMVSEEIPAVLHDILPLSTDRADTFVAGLSMGGYGSYKLALTCPDKFAAAASLSGAVDLCEVVKPHDDPQNAAWLELMRNNFGDLESVPGSKHDLFSLARNVAQSDVKPRLFQCCGTEDFLYQDNLRFRDFIRTQPFDYKYMEGPGEHTWAFWDVMIQNYLDWLNLK